MWIHTSHIPVSPETATILVTMLLLYPTPPPPDQTALLLNCGFAPLSSCLEWAFSKAGVSYLFLGLQFYSINQPACLCSCVSLTITAVNILEMTTVHTLPLHLSRPYGAIPFSLKEGSSFAMMESLPKLRTKTQGFPLRAEVVFKSCSPNAMA